MSAAALERDPDWYRCSYMLAVANAMVAQAHEGKLVEIPPEELQERKDQARAHVIRVATVIESDLLSLSNDRKSGQSKDSRSEFLLALEPSVLVLLAGVIRRWDWAPPAMDDRSGHADAQDEASVLEGAETLLSRVRQALIVAKGRLARVRPRSHVDADRQRLLDSLRDRGRTIEGPEIIALVEGLNVDYRARYNLACYYAGQGDDAVSDDARRLNYEHAFSQLGEALRNAPADLVKWSDRDLSLMRLREDECFGPKYASLVKGLTQPAKPRPRFNGGTRGSSQSS